MLNVGDTYVADDEGEGIEGHDGDVRTCGAGA